MQGSESDEALVQRAQKGDNAATELLLRRYMDTVRACARGFFLVGGETEDLVQEGMIGLYAAIGDFRKDGGKTFKNFAYLCIKRQIFDAIKGSGRRKNGPLNNYVPLSDPELDAFVAEDPEKFLIEREANRELKVKLMKELSDFEFRVVTMYLDGMSYAEICEATGKDLKSIDNALARAKKKLQRAFAR